MKRVLARGKALGLNRSSPAVTPHVQIDGEAKPAEEYAERCGDDGP